MLCSYLPKVIGKVSLSCQGLEIREGLVLILLIRGRVFRRRKGLSASSDP